MLSPKQQTLGFANYPVGRPAFFAIRFQCHVLRRGVAYEVGTDGLAILMLVSTAEDRTRYSKPVAFWNDHLCGMVGLSRERFFAARKKLVERGWLCYSPGARGRAPTYFVTVPGGDDQVDGSVLGESPADELTSELGRISRPNSPPIADLIHHQSPTQFTTPSTLLPESEESSSLPSDRHPERDTLPAPPVPREEEVLEEGGKEADGLEPRAYGQTPESESVTSPALGPRPSPLGRSQILDRLRQEFPRGFGIRRAVWTLDQALKSITLEQVAAILSHAWDQQIDGRLPWEAGAVVMRLTDPDLVQLPASEGWAAPNPDWVKLDGRRQRDAAAERERLAKREEQLKAEEKRTADLAARKQLELDFGPLVDQVEQSAPERLWSILRAKNVERVVRSSPEGFRGKIARLLLLRAAEAGEL